jgi:polynucleotide 5'-hydroxyl-kinase GRC3/NOL9
MERQHYPEWQEAIANIAEAGGTVVLIGSTDSGKTTFCTLLANAALEAGKRVAVVDADIGQSEIGPPGCVGMGLPQESIRSLSDIAPTALAFVGSTTPRGCLLEHAVATRLMTDAARVHDPHLVIIDTTGYVIGPGGSRLKHAKLSLLTPDHVVALARGRECDEALMPLKFTDRVHVHRLPVPAVIATKPPTLRAQRRAGGFARYFLNAELREYSLDDIALSGTWLNGGPCLPPHLLRFLSRSLGVYVYHAEEHERRICMMTRGWPPREEGIAAIQEQFRVPVLTITPAQRLHHLLTGLADQNGNWLGIGLIEALDFRRHTIGILTPLRAPTACRLIRFGTLRVKSDGTELGTIRPGEV